MALNINLKKQEDYFNDIFGDSGIAVKDISISDLRPYKNNQNQTQPFRMYQQDKLDELAEDIKTNGLMQPIIVRKMIADDENPYDYYQILAGHNRAKACELVGMEKIPAIVKKDISDAEAQLIMVNTNLNQREELLHSEKAFAYKMQMDATKQMGTRNDLLHNVQKVDTTEMIAKNSCESKRNISYYIRLTYLIPDLLSMVDEKELPFRSGVALSYLSEAEQYVCFDYMDSQKISFSVENSEDIKRYKQDIEGAVITKEVLDKLFAKPAKEKKEKPFKITISNDYVNKYFGGKSAKEVEKELVQILDEHFNKQE